MKLLYLVFCLLQPLELLCFSVFNIEVWPLTQVVRAGSYLNQNSVLPVETCSCRGLYFHRSDQDGWLQNWISSLAEPHWSVKDAGRGIMLWLGCTAPAVAPGLLPLFQQCLFWSKPNRPTPEEFKIKVCVF